MGKQETVRRATGDLDVIVFDIQDVGARFYTYISTMHYVMEACAENNKEFIVLDRPNPNDFVDGRSARRIRVFRRCRSAPNLARLDRRGIGMDDQ